MSAKVVHNHDPIRHPDEGVVGELAPDKPREHRGVDREPVTLSEGPIPPLRSCSKSRVVFLARLRDTESSEPSLLFIDQAYSEYKETCWLPISSTKTSTASGRELCAPTITLQRQPLRTRLVPAPSRSVFWLKPPVSSRAARRWNRSRPCARHAALHEAPPLGYGGRKEALL